MKNTKNINNEDMLKKLKKLVQLDIDAVHAYDQAIKKIDHLGIRSKIRKFKEDHERHIFDLSNIIRDLGGEVPKRDKDMKGYFIEGFTKMRSMSGTEGALKAMKTNEELTNKVYNDALEFPFSLQVKEIVAKNRQDERRHLNFIERAIRDKLWENTAYHPEELDQERRAG